MEAKIKELSKLVQNIDKADQLIRSIIQSITSNDEMLSAVEEILPFLSDGDRTVRLQSMNLISAFNDAFESGRPAFSDMAITKLADNATLYSSCRILTTNINLLTDEQVDESLNKLFTATINACILSHRKAAFTFLSLLVQKLNKPIPADYVDNFHRISAAESHSDVLEILFDLFPSFCHAILPSNLNTAQFEKLFNCLSGLYPICGRPMLASKMHASMIAVPEFSGEIAKMLENKLTNSLADTRLPVYQSMPELLLLPTPTDTQIGVINAFITSLKEFYKNGGAEFAESVYLDAIDSMMKWCSDETIKKLTSLAITNWIVSIIDCEDIYLIHSISVVAWNFDKICHFAQNAILPLAYTVSDAAKQINNEKTHAVFACVIEYLKLQTQPPSQKLDEFLNAANTVLSFKPSTQYGSKSFSPSCIQTTLTLIRELANHSTLIYIDGLVSNIVKSEQPNIIPTLIALSTQPQYNDALFKEFTSSVINDIHAGAAHATELAIQLAKTESFQCTFLMALAENGKFRQVKLALSPIRCLLDETSGALLDLLDQQQENLIVLDVALRTSPEVLKQSLTSTSFITDQLLFVAPIEFSQIVPAKSDFSRIAVEAKIADSTSPISQMISAKKFDPNSLQLLYQFETCLDSAFGEAFSHDEIYCSRFVYNPEYKQTMWDALKHQELDVSQKLVLFLLCPPSCFDEDPNNISLIPEFLKLNPLGGLTLLLSVLEGFTPKKHLGIIKILSTSMDLILPLFKTGDGRTRLKACQVLKQMALKVSPDAIGVHKHLVVKLFQTALDDPKRIVRLEAAAANQQWINIKAINI